MKKLIQIGWWEFDGMNLIYRENGESHLTGLVFDSVKDARWAAAIFLRFIYGKAEGAGGTR